MLLLLYQDGKVEYVETQLWVPLQGFDAGSHIVSLDIKRLHGPHLPVWNTLLPTPVFVSDSLLLATSLPYIILPPPQDVAKHKSF